MFLQIKTKIVSCHTADSKPVKQEVNGTMILPPLAFPSQALVLWRGSYPLLQYVGAPFPTPLPHRTQAYEVSSAFKYDPEREDGASVAYLNALGSRDGEGLRLPHSPTARRKAADIVGYMHSYRQTEHAILIPTYRQR